MKKLIVIIGAAISVVIIGGIMNITTQKEEYIKLQITQQEWTGWSEVQPAPVIENKKVKVGDTITVDWMSSKADITIEKITNDTVKVSFEVDGIAKADENSIDFNSTDTSWLEEIRNHENYAIGTQTLDMGCTWTLQFTK